MTERNESIQAIVSYMQWAYRCGYDGIFEVTHSFDNTQRDCWKMGQRQRQIDDATHTLETYGRGRITDASTTGFWIQIDHDRSRIAQLQAAVAVLDRLGLIEYHPRKGNPRNVRIRDVLIATACPGGNHGKKAGY